MIGMNEKHRLFIEALAGTPRDVVRLTKRLSDAQALARAAPDEWCVKDVVAHLLDIEPRFRARLIRMLEQDQPREPTLGPDPGAHDLDRPLFELIAEFAAERDRTTHLLAGLTHQQWLRTCVHQIEGVSKLRQQVAVLVGHDNAHLAQIVGLREFLDRREIPRRVS
jgi:hypothetical protein